MRYPSCGGHMRMEMVGVCIFFISLYVVPLAETVLLYEGNWDEGAERCVCVEGGGD